MAYGKYVLAVSYHCLTKNKRIDMTKTDMKKLKMYINNIYESSGEDGVTKMVSQMYSDYIELAKIATNNEYQAGWTHKELIEYLKN